MTNDQYRYRFRTRRITLKFAERYLRNLNKNISKDLCWKFVKKFEAIFGIILFRSIEKWNRRRNMEVY